MNEPTLQPIGASVAPARPELTSRARVMGMRFPAVADALRNVLGARLTAYVGGVEETRAVHAWAEGLRRPSEATQQRLRHALVLALTIADADGPEVAQAWFQGLNPQLDDRSPARHLREGDLDDIGPEVTTVARAFLADG
jgi:hypothetical protein